ncbi:hypothetical protein T310_6792 [Rasamsonia emersonii CBS 393.64]|uniref:Uncharacterized protein n=1 Tax=Rasamsonia emersonii (strain ATCC 16479 / CBS 393.64 / IMI 116815) TaxID=1408163 RepID=A0A0F4YNP4_RASE3|nr:hypothetical protein T310_6792 [Rasamsonia emersonii CBS 393.64]KKA19253.1 hypothetical protein T310_6792 [Rasamsonia emersonii CBS 393.64]
MAGKSDEELHRRLEDQAWPHRQNHVDPTPDHTIQTNQIGGLNLEKGANHSAAKPSIVGARLPCSKTSCLGLDRCNNGRLDKEHTFQRARGQHGTKRRNHPPGNALYHRSSTPSDHGSIVHVPLPDESRDTDRDHGPGWHDNGSGRFQSDQLDHFGVSAGLRWYWRRWELFSLFGHVPGVGASGEVCQVHEFGIGGVFAVAALGTHLRRCHQSIVNVEMGLFIEHTTWSTCWTGDHPRAPEPVSLSCNTQCPQRILPAPIYRRDRAARGLSGHWTASRRYAFPRGLPGRSQSRVRMAVCLCDHPACYIWDCLDLVPGLGTTSHPAFRYSGASVSMEVCPEQDLDGDATQLHFPRRDLVRHHLPTPAALSDRQRSVSVAGRNPIYSFHPRCARWICDSTHYRQGPQTAAGLSRSRGVDHPGHWLLTAVDPTRVSRHLRLAVRISNHRRLWLRDQHLASNPHDTVRGGGPRQSCRHGSRRSIPCHGRRHLPGNRDICVQRHYSKRAEGFSVPGSDRCGASIDRSHLHIPSHGAGHDARGVFTGLQSSVQNPHWVRGRADSIIVSDVEEE